MVSPEWLKKTELFEGLDESQLNALLSHASVESFPEGKTIFHQGEEANRLFVLIEGAIDLSVKAEEKIAFMTSEIKQEGAVFGMPSLFESFRFNVTATCLKTSQVLIFEGDRIKKEMIEDPKMGMEIMKKLSSMYFYRLNEMRSGVSKLVKLLKIKTP